MARISKSVERGGYEETERDSGYSLLAERAPGMIVLSKQRPCSLNVRSGTNLNLVPERGRRVVVLDTCAQVRPTHSPRKRGCCAGEPTWMPFLSEKKVQEREGGTDEIGSGT